MLTPLHEGTGVTRPEGDGKTGGLEASLQGLSARVDVPPRIDDGLLELHGREHRPPALREHACERDWHAEPHSKRRIAKERPNKKPPHQKVGAGIALSMHAEYRGS